MIKYTNQFLTKLEDLIAESDYILRYEKGNFKSGYCLLKEQKIMIVNKFFTVEGKINALLDILKNLELDPTRFSEKSKKLYEELHTAEVKSWGFDLSIFDNTWRQFYIRMHQQVFKMHPAGTHLSKRSSFNFFWKSHFSEPELHKVYL